eukprot:COSAG05_NODE_1271_length_5315_cov_2.397738_7_plen_55_part_00
MLTTGHSRASAAARWPNLNELAGGFRHSGLTWPEPIWAALREANGVQNTGPERK